ncbi:MAG: hypothetical protein NC040_08980 [Muribaculaceae bacterium]|nr:hypothetical protein [Alistipes senegalensis]MCM1474180.1 hypothetical protein [Muribaculaceae bacterium]
MKKKQGFFSRLKKSTIITMVSCGSFVVMTFLALLFFVKFPLKPSERIISSMGRQGIYKQNVSYSESTTTTQTTIETTTQQTTANNTTHKEFVITITTGKGFKTEVKGHDVPVMDYDYSDYEDDEEETTETTTDYEDDEYNYNDYNYDYY